MKNQTHSNTAIQTITRHALLIFFRYDMLLFMSSFSSISPYLSFITARFMEKKRAAEATRRKTHDSFAATQLNTQDRYIRIEHVLLPEKKHIPVPGKILFSCVARLSYHSLFEKTIAFIKKQPVPGKKRAAALIVFLQQDDHG